MLIAKNNRQRNCVLITLYIIVLEVGSRAMTVGLCLTAIVTVGQRVITINLGQVIGLKSSNIYAT